MDQIAIPATFLSYGTSIGVVFREKINLVGSEVMDIPENKRDKQKEILLCSIEKSIEQIMQIVEKVKLELGQEKAEIFEGHIEILRDEYFQKEMIQLVSIGYSAVCAALTVGVQNAFDLESLEDAYIRERASDFRDIAKRIAINASEKTKEKCDSKPKNTDNEIYTSSSIPKTPSIIVAEELSPSKTVQYDLSNVIGFIVAKGGQNSHAAILARSLQKPAVLIPQSLLELLHHGDEVAIDEQKAKIFIHPNEKTKKRLLENNLKEKEESLKLEKLKLLPSEMTCGYKIKISANIGCLEDLPLVDAKNADGIGLFRTEFLFMNETSFPSVNKQVDLYQQVIESAKGKSVTFRLLDIGGDKPLPYAPQETENNPVLGIRGVRYLLRNPDILKNQIRALLLASANTKQMIQIMVPMVCENFEMKSVRTIFEEEIKYTNGLATLGMMVETPAVAMSLHAFKDIADFISIGSNDLTQYSLAVDREHQELQSLYSEFNPGVLALIYRVCIDAKKIGIKVGSCGELASKKEAVLLLVAMGFDELSMNPNAILQAKKIIRSNNFQKAENLLNRVLTKNTSIEIIQEVQSFL